MKEILELNYEQNRRYRNAISLGFFDDYEADPRAWKHTFKGAFVWRYPSRLKQLRHLTDIVGRTPEWEDLTDDVIKDFAEETSESMAASSARTVCAELKALLNANRRRVPAADFNTVLTLRNEASQHVYLSRSEMERFIAYKPRGKAERFAYRNFCVSLMTGARLCDAKAITIHNCDNNTGMLSYIPMKTPGIIVRVPVDERHNLRAILSMANIAECCLDVYNETIRTICRRIGLYEEVTVTKAGRTVTASKWQLVSSHTARRSFATNLFLAGISLEDVALMMGHGKNIETTKRYICAERKVTPSVMAYFQPEET